MAILRSLFGSCTGLASGSETPQILIVGLEKSGKTTLLYRLRLDKEDWEANIMKRELLASRTPKASGETDDYGYHYEELPLMKNCTCGLWEVPGTPAVRSVWQTFYRAIKFHAVLFVVDGSEKKEEQILCTRRHLQFLLNEDELRNCPFVVIINEKDRPKGQKMDDETKVLHDIIPYKLGLHDLHPSCEWRVRWDQLNCLNLDQEKDPVLQPMREWLKEKVQDPRGHGLKL